MMIVFIFVFNFGDLEKPKAPPDDHPVISREAEKRSNWNPIPDRRGRGSAEPAHKKYTSDPDWYNGFVAG